MLHTLSDEVVAQAVMGARYTKTFS